MGYYTNFITEEGVQKLTKYKYNSCPYTTIDNIFNKWWYFAVEFAPRVTNP
jgi:hypothetical protein